MLSLAINLKLGTKGEHLRRQLNFLKATFHKFYFFYRLILCFISSLKGNRQKWKAPQILFDPSTFYRFCEKISTYKAMIKKF